MSRTEMNSGRVVTRAGGYGNIRLTKRPIEPKVSDLHLDQKLGAQGFRAALPLVSVMSFRLDRVWLFQNAWEMMI